MTEKRKIIYISIIVACLASSVVILWLTFGKAPIESSDTPPPVVNDIILETGTELSPSGNSSSNFAPPSVFPNNPNFNYSVLDSDEYQKLIPYQPVQIDQTELGRNNPFNEY